MSKHTDSNTVAEVTLANMEVVIAGAVAMGANLADEGASTDQLARASEDYTRRIFGE